MSRAVSSREDDADKRLRYVWSSLLGEAVDVFLKEDSLVLDEKQTKIDKFNANNMLQGVVRTFLPPLAGFKEDETVSAELVKKQMEYGVDCLVLVGAMWIPANPSGEKSGRELKDMVIPISQVNRISARTALRPAQSTQPFKTDVEISNAGDKERELKMWDEGEMTQEITWDEDDYRKTFDQFKRNEELFGVQTAYNEDMYTTALNIRDVDPTKLQKAALMANEIEKHQGKRSTQDRDGDEEDRYGAVLSDKTFKRGSKVTGDTGRKDDSNLFVRHTKPGSPPQIIQPKNYTNNPNGPQPSGQEVPQQAQKSAAQPATAQPAGNYTQHPMMKPRYDSKEQHARAQIEALRDEIVRELHDTNVMVHDWMCQMPEYQFDISDTCSSLIARTLDRDNHHVAKSATHVGTIMQERRRLLNHRRDLTREDIEILSKDLVTHDKNIPNVIDDEDKAHPNVVKRLRSQLGTHKLNRMIHGGEYLFLDEGFHRRDLKARPTWKDDDPAIPEADMSDEPLPSSTIPMFPGSMSTPFTPGSQPGGAPPPFMRYGGSVPPPMTPFMTGPDEMYDPGSEYQLVMFPMPTHSVMSNVADGR